MDVGGISASHSDKVLACTIVKIAGIRSRQTSNVLESHVESTMAQMSADESPRAFSI
jgi:hypothetical protein